MTTNKEKWELVFNGKNGYSITFKQNEKDDYNLIDIRRISEKSNEQNLSIYIVGKKIKQFIFNNRKDALKFLFKEYPELKVFNKSIKEVKKCL